MSLLASALAVVEAPAPLIMPAWAFAVIGISFFTLVGFVSWSFRDVANRHANKTGGKSSHGAGH